MKKKTSYKYPLITLGDSLTLGFQNGAVCSTKFSYPSILAKLLEDKYFQTVSFTAQGGLPLNMEVLLKGIEEEFGTEIGWDDSVQLTNSLVSTLLRVKRYWEQDWAHYNNGEKLKQPYSNQSLFSATVNDIFLLTDADCKQILEKQVSVGNRFQLLPQNAFYTAARKIINPNLSPFELNSSLFSNVKWFSDHGGIEHFIVYLGANNLIGAITDLKVVEATRDDLLKKPFDRNVTVYSSQLFQQSFENLAVQLSELSINHIYTATIPDITKLPLLQKIEINDEYIYTHIWVKKNDFDKDIHPFLREDEIIHIQNMLFEYNLIIKKTAQIHGWKVLDVYSLVEKLHLGQFDEAVPAAAIRALRKNKKTRYLINDDSSLNMDTQFAELDESTEELIHGGIFSLDGLHPSTFAYGLIAFGFQQLMQQNGQDFNEVFDWDKIIENDSLLTDTPLLINDLRKALYFISADYSAMFTKIGKHLFEEFGQIFGGKI
jgi:hypothetical protein